MDGPTATQRARAAWAYSGLGQKKLAAKSGVEYHQLRAILAPANTAPVSTDDLWLIAAAAGVPKWFMTEGFESDRLAEHENRLIRLERAVRQLGTAALAQSTGQAREGLPRPQGKPQDPSAKAPGS